MEPQNNAPNPNQQYPDQPAQPYQNSATQTGPVLQPRSAPTQNQAPTKKPSVAKALLIMFTPGIVLVASILIYAVVNFVLGATSNPAGGSELFNSEPSPAMSIINILLFLAGAVSVLAVVPCLIIGIVLLTRR